MSFDDLREKPRPQNYFLRTDWSSVEEKYKTGLKDFIAGIEPGNAVLESPKYGFDPEKIPKLEPVVSKEVPKEPEKTYKKLQDDPTLSVESVNVPGRNVSSPALQPMQPTQPQESVLSTPEVDPFDDVIQSAPEAFGSGADIFDFVDTKKIEPAKAATTKISIDSERPTISIKTVEIDPFDEIVAPTKPATETASAATPVAPQPIPVAPQPIPVATKAAEPAQPAKLASVPASAALNETSPFKASKNLEGFDYEKYNEIRAICDEMLKGLPDLDLDGLRNLLPDYSVCMDMDYLRANPHVLTDKILEIQSKRDSLHPHLLKLWPVVAVIKKAAKYYEEVGVDCSTASSREKRLAQFLLVNSQFAIREAQVEGVSVAAQQTFDHLCEQYECASRLITGFQQTSKEISRGEFPYIAPPPAPVRQAAPVAAPVVAKPMGTPPRNDADDDFMNRSMSQPLQSSTNCKPVESFVSGTRPAAKTTEANTGTSDVPW